MSQNVRAMVLTGGASRRMGSHKPAIQVAGLTMVARVLRAAAAYHPIVVGSGAGVPDRVPVVPDDHPGAGPVAGIATGLTHIPDADVVVVLAADLPSLSDDHLSRLVAAVPPGGCAVTVRQARPQWLCAAWSRQLLQRQLSAGISGRSMRSLYAETAMITVTDDEGASRDVDTPAELQRLIGGD